ncbi:hypothetical protein PsorP6_006193 [Peronosclerospora sorghi]|uniref:Uncharacterized protein n=1 Tax=Peronosclerospora sorghi TaxID=230839 RepID=A0ACC0W3V2_9STRA|nr:hypothetical protein PsorP6_006193 [Peronosclerospora sorghi]
MASQWMMVVSLTLLSALVLGTYTYPKCSDNGQGCCQFGTGLMKNRGFIIVALDEGDMAVTCSKGSLRCSYENPEKQAHEEASLNVSCPDFTSLMESRTEITYLEGVQNKPSADTLATGNVKAPEN